MTISVDEILSTVTDAVNGDECPARVYEGLRVAESILKEAICTISSLLIDEIDHRGDVGTAQHKFKVVARKTYSYNHDEVHCELKKRLKDHEKFMRDVMYMGEVMNTETGEVVRPAKVSTSRYVKMEKV